MQRKAGTVRVGTSGWQYRHWAGAFYPAGTRPADMLAVYCRRFGTVEINATFYRLPNADSAAAWRKTAPEGFVFACKANRFITHMKKLKDPGTSLPAFLSLMDGFGDKAGPMLFQLPPHWRVNRDRLAAFLDHLPPGRRAAFEFRDPTWWTDDVLSLLRDRGAGFCCFDLAGTKTPFVTTADFAYLRLHGPGAAYRGSYSDERLQDWAAEIRQWADAGLDVFVYFDNDADAHAPRNAESLVAMLQTGRQARPGD